MIGDIEKSDIIMQAKQLGAELVGFAPVSRWDEFDEVEKDYRPKSVWQPAQTVIVLGVPLILPMVETTPSIVYSELYNTTNTLLDNLAYQLSIYLMKKGHQAFYMPRDGYGDIHILVKKPVASFGHVTAAKYAGLGTIGYNHCLLNAEYGPRVRYVSVLTDAVIEPSPMIEKNLCIHCGLCEKLCPSNAFRPVPGEEIAQMDKVACAKHHAVLREEHRYPCGICIKVCPIGQDRTLFQNKNSKVYLQEKNTIEEGREETHEQYKAWVHIRSHGSSGDRRY